MPNELSSEELPGRQWTSTMVWTAAICVSITCALALWRLGCYAPTRRAGDLAAPYLRMRCLSRALISYALQNGHYPVSSDAHLGLREILPLLAKCTVWESAEECAHQVSILASEINNGAIAYLNLPLAPAGGIGEVIVVAASETQGVLFVVHSDGSVATAVACGDVHKWVGTYVTHDGFYVASQAVAVEYNERVVIPSNRTEISSGGLRTATEWAGGTVSYSYSGTRRLTEVRVATSAGTTERFGVNVDPCNRIISIQHLAAQ